MGAFLLCEKTLLQQQQEGGTRGRLLKAEIMFIRHSSTPMSTCTFTSRASDRNIQYLVISTKTVGSISQVYDMRNEQLK